MPVRFSYVSKLIAIIVFLLVDLSLNSVLDYASFNDNNNGKRAYQLLLGLAGLHVVVQITIFLILFLAMADTFLFRVGLLGLLMKKFRGVVLMQVLYLVFTIALGAYRVREFNRGDTLATLWTDDTYISLSSIQKIGNP
jgi:hypothetical protein